jgi:hypothetical protein
MILIKKRLWMCHKLGAKVMAKKMKCQGVVFFRPKIRLDFRQFKT